MEHIQTIKIINTLGLHARPAMLLAETASKFEASITIRRMDRKKAIDGKSIMELMMLAATKGTNLEVHAKGKDAKEAVKAIHLLVQKSFNECP